MASLLDYGAGAYSGLEDQLEREYKRQVLERLIAADAEQSRHNQAGEEISRENTRENAEWRKMQQGSLDETREANRQNILRDDIRARSAMRDKGDKVTPQEYEEETNIGKLPTGRYKKTEGTEYQPLPPDQDGPGRMNDQFEWLGTPQKATSMGQTATKGVKLNGKRIMVQETPDGRLIHQGRDITDEPGLAPDQSDDRVLMPIQTDNGVFYGSRGSARGAPVPLPAAVQTNVVGNEQSDAQLDRLQEMFDAGASEMIGPMEGRARRIGQSIPGVEVDQTFADFDAATIAFTNSVIKAITGAQMSEPEARRIKGQIPQTSDKPEVWRAKAQATRANLRDLNAIIARRTGGQGAPTDGGAPAPKRKRYDLNGNELP
jgi:hypothetical protein